MLIIWGNISRQRFQRYKAQFADEYVRENDEDAT